MNDNNMQSNPQPGGSKSKQGLIIGIVVVILIVIGIIWFAARGTQPALAPGEETGTDEAAGLTSEVSELDEGTEPIIAQEANVKEFSISNDGLKFATNSLTVAQGDTVRITFTNTGGTHDWRLDEFNVGTKVLEQGQSETVEFVADKVGQYEYYCSVMNHRQMGMTGTLIVE